MQNMNQNFSIPTETERDILNIADAIRALLEQDDFTDAMNESPLTLSEVEDMADLMDAYAKKLYEKEQDANG
jgi:hypothetical protein